MTISSTNSRWAYTGDGIVVGFAYDNRIFADTDLEVYVDGALQTLTTHYSVSGVGDTGGQRQRGDRAQRAIDIGHRTAGRRAVSQRVGGKRGR